MNGVDKSDQSLAKYNLLRKCVKWLKTICFHMIDIATVNSFILFQSHIKKHPELVKRKDKVHIIGLSWGTCPGYFWFRNICGTTCLSTTTKTT